MCVCVSVRERLVIRFMILGSLTLTVTREYKSGACVEYLRKCWFPETEFQINSFGLAKWLKTFDSQTQVYASCCAYSVVEPQVYGLAYSLLKLFKQTYNCKRSSWSLCWNLRVRFCLLRAVFFKERLSITLWKGVQITDFKAAISETPCNFSTRTTAKV